MSAMRSKQEYTPKILRERRERLQKDLSRLSRRQPVVVQLKPSLSKDNSLRNELQAEVRIRNSSMRLSVYEDFREDLSRAPLLHEFRYHLILFGEAEPVTLFRYECHPDFEDAPTQSLRRTEAKQNPYSIVPHYHPDETSREILSELHYPFQRWERQSIIFALISWLEVDMCNRFGIQ